MKLKDLPNHHAVLLVHENRVDIADMLWNELNIKSQANRYFNQTVLDIDTARNAISWAQTPYNDEKVALISFSSATIPAQNAMLKILEEPRSGVRFILLTSNKSNLLDTVLSRVHEFKTKNEKRKTKNESDAEEFLKTSHGSRMKLPFLVELLARIDEEGRKDRESVRSFILSLSSVLVSFKVKSRYIIETIKIASYASDSSVSGKALIEYLALLLPQVKA